ncbi:MAG: DUF547 domain-containing protein [Flavobacteriaceae bacterium]|nr:DUF547 domain-containing protein [Flavobacteriaceae bacterium]
MKKMNFISFSILIASFAMILSSCNATKKVVSEPISEVVVVEEVVNETKEDSIIEVEVITETDVIIQNDTISEVEEVIEETLTETFDHSIWNELLKKHVSEKGNVNYKGFKNDYTVLKSYLKSLSENIPEDTWTKEDGLAYWINAYNAFTVKLIVDRYPLESIKDIESPWDFRFIKLGKKWFTLNDIEHKILRKMDDPRIHFGIVCASFSCPKLQNKAFIASTINIQLDDATKEFLSDTSRNNLSENNIQLSKIFKWFAKDFKKEGSLIDFLNKYSEITITQNAKKSFKAYNWDLNE